MVRRIGVEEFGEGADTVGRGELGERLEEGQGGGTVLIYAVMGQGEGAEEPCPDSALMVGGVAFARAAGIGGGVAGFAGGEAAQAVGGDEVGGAGVHYGFLLIGGERAGAERDGED